MTLLKGVAAFGDTVFVDTLTEICEISGVRLVESMYTIRKY